MKPDDSHAPAGWPADESLQRPGTALVGGLPWDQPDRPPSPAPLPPGAVVVEAERTEDPVSPLDWLSWPFLRTHIDRLVQKSPAWTVSLSLHVLLLLVLALLVVRREEPRKLRLDVAFSNSAGDAAGGQAAEATVEAAAADTDPAETEPMESPEEASNVVPKEALDRSDVVTIELPPADSTASATSVEPEAPAANGAGTTAAVRPAAPIGTALEGRAAGRRQALVEGFGGTAASELAVALALDWIARQQRKDGLWSLQGPYADGGRQENRLAASALALLALQGAGNTPEEGEWRGEVARGWKALLRVQQEDGSFDLGSIPEVHQMYAHGQITIALCESLGMTKDPRFAEPARRALDYCIAAQMPDGGWRYHPPRPNAENRGDMSVTGWYLMALKSGEMAGLTVPAATYQRLAAFLDGVFVSPEKGYGYQINPLQKVFDFRPALTAEALLCRQYLGWPRDDPRLTAGVDLLLREAPLDLDYLHKNVYAWYYETQVFHHVGGAAWRQWNGWMQTRLVPAQVAKGRERGSWDPANDQWGYVGGRLFMTSLCACMLEVYYRHMPLHEPPEPAAP